MGDSVPCMATAASHPVRSITGVKVVCVFLASSQAGAELCKGCALSPIRLVIFMDRISTCSQGLESVQYGELTIASLLFVDEVALLASSSCDLQNATGWFPGACSSVKHSG